MPCCIENSNSPHRKLPCRRFSSGALAPWCTPRVLGNGSVSVPRNLTRLLQCPEKRLQRVPEGWHHHRFQATNRAEGGSGRVGFVLRPLPVTPGRGVLVTLAPGAGACRALKALPAAPGLRHHQSPAGPGGPAHPTLRGPARPAARPPQPHGERPRRAGGLRGGRALPRGRPPPLTGADRPAGARRLQRIRGGRRGGRAAKAASAGSGGAGAAPASREARWGHGGAGLHRHRRPGHARDTGQTRDTPGTRSGHTRDTPGSRPRPSGNAPGHPHAPGLAPPVAHSPRPLAAHGSRPLTAPGLSRIPVPHSPRPLAAPGPGAPAPQLSPNG